MVKTNKPQTHRPSYLKLLFRQYWSGRLNRFALVFMIVLFSLAFFAPWLAGNSPYYLKYQGKSYFPILSQVLPFRLFISYPSLKELDYKKMKLEKGDFRFFPPVPYSPTEYDLDATLISPQSSHWLGTDEQGRDVLSRMIHGSRISLSVGFVAVGIAVVIGIFLGALAGFYGGKVDILISRAIEVMICFPTFFLILAVIAFIGPGLLNIMIVIGATGWTGVARLVRGEFFKLRNQEFVLAVQSLGSRASRIIFRHLLPNALAPVMISASFGVASAILTESALSYLGFGIQPPTPSWGDILSQSQDFMDIAWWLTLFPGVSIFITVTMFNLVGEGLRDAVDPRAKPGN